MIIKLNYYSHLLLQSKIKLFLPLIIYISYSFLHNDLSNISLCEEVKNNNETNQTIFGMGLFVGSIILVFLLQQISPSIDPSIDPSGFSETILSTMDACTNVTPDMLSGNTETPFKSSSSTGFFIKSPEEFDKMLSILENNKQTSWIRFDAYEQLEQILKNELVLTKEEYLHSTKIIYWLAEYQEYLKGFCKNTNYIPTHIEWLQIEKPEGYNEIFGPAFGEIGIEID